MAININIKNLLKERDLDYIFFFNMSGNNSNFLYASALSSGLFEGGILIINKDNVELLTSILEYEEAVESKSNLTKVTKIEKRSDYSLHLSRCARGKRIGLDLTSISYDYYKKIIPLLGASKIVDISTDMAQMRLIKSSNEIIKMKKAVKITKETFDAILPYIKEGISEKALAARINYIMMARGANTTAFPSIVSFGKNAALPHHMPSNVKLNSNNFILMDIGARVDNYCADMTRTIIFKPDKKTTKYMRMSQMINIVKTAQSEAFKYIISGESAQKPHIVAQSIIDSAFNGRYKGTFIHSLGHSIGIDVHDSSNIGLSLGVKDKLSSGMVFSDEPGIYINNFGGVRFEDDVLITKNGPEFL